ncbi:Starch-binding associating with outer membrane [Mariniphaga anaerophila]|uniref:Starch-binding associating with outer membrane n=1 Tax=Mariniphaga anaerophila TaxID=1484053 RepID=A0A1M4Y4T3_9BACT|nr:RagB/SusD family nutrient uptake outer membrane protein [Mariniphaga anaerophila]SHF00680.1 Starch-binding associating with outer membrane [Mariniphaga anaerophila]
MNKIRLILGLCVFALCFNSCSDFLEEQPVSEIPADKMWKTSRDAKAGVSEIYGLFRKTMRANYFYWGEFRSDNVAQGAPAANTQARVIDNLLTTDHACTEWTDLYRMINQANLAIKYIANIDMPSVSERNDLLGQAYAMRALGYFYAVRVWGDVPLFTEPNEMYSKDLYRSRTDKNEILNDVILADLKKAEELIDRTKNKERKRISIYGVWAVMADVYMWLEDYNLADQTISKMGNDPSFMAFEPEIETWRKMFVEELNGKSTDNTPENDEYTTKEFIFVIHFNMEEVGEYGYSYMYQWFTGGGNRAAVLSDKFVSLLEEDDLRKPYIMMDYQGGNELNKFIGGTISTTLNKTCQVAYPVYRYTDMLLLQAEARARLGKWEEALQLVKQVRDRAGLNTPTAIDFFSEDDIIDYILTERQIELVGEGRRWFDLVRTGKWKEVMEPINGMKDDGNELFPIHYSHIIQNPSIVQNPYYGN